MTAEQTFMKFGFAKEENHLRIKEIVKNNNELKEIYIDTYSESPLIPSTSFMLLLRTFEKNVIVIFDGDRLILKKNDKQETQLMNVLISRITECFSKICEDYSEFILNIQNIYYKITVFN